MSAIKWKATRSQMPTEEDSCSDREEEFIAARTNPAKHKTELCKTYSAMGCCPYQDRCKFAHGAYELVRQPTLVILKARKCKGFWKKGFCAYGVRCQFGHAEADWQIPAVLSGLLGLCEPIHVESKLLGLLY